MVTGSKRRAVVSPGSKGFSSKRSVLRFQWEVEKAQGDLDGVPGLDWRRSYDDLDHSLVDPPPDVAEGVHDYLAAFGLVYGAFDFGLDAAGRWHWYECNPMALGEQ